MFRLTRTTSVLALLLILTGVLANCVPSTQSGASRTFTIAVVEDNPGEPGNPNPHSAYAGAKLAVDQMQAHGGVTVDIVPYFDNDNVTIAEQRAQEIVNSNAIAVIGHSSEETSRAVAEVYEQAGIPVVNYMPVTEKLTDEFQYYFNTTYTAESEAAYIANYLRKINGAETATIIRTNDLYGQTLAKQFKNTFQGLGGQITIEGVVRGSDDQGLEDVVSNIISVNTETTNPGTIFIAADEETAAQLIILMKRKGVSYPIVGASTLSTPAFLDVILAQQEEESIPGYFTDGILTTRALIFDSANRYANQFRHDYQTVYGLDPGDQVVNGYDAALVVVSALQNSDVTGQGDDVEIDRQKTFNALLALDDSQDSVQGIVAPIYFEPSRNVIRVARFGIYQNGEIVSANTQFEPISMPNEIKDLQEQIEKGRIMTVNGAYAYKANVVYAGVDLLGIEEIDIKTSTYKVDFYLWFRYSPSEQDEDFQPDDFIFTNAEGDVESVLIREEPNSDGTFLKTYRVSGIFKNQFQFHDYPFDHQDLIIEFRNQNANTSFIQYVVDQIGMRYTSEAELLENFRDNGAFDAIYGWNERAVNVTQDIFPTFSTLGSPQNFDRKVSTNYSLINVRVDIQRTSLQYIVKSLLPLLITLVLAYITFFLPLGHEERLAVGSTALLTTAFFHLTLADTLPEIGYTVAMEYLFYASYVMSALIVLFETLSSRLEKLGEEARKKADKERYEDQRVRLNMIGRLIYPAILFFVIAAGYFVYNGSIHLGPGEVESKHLVDFVLESAASFSADSNERELPVESGDEVRLTLTTWRPEDSKQIQSLLDEFNTYARDVLNKNIVIEHEPIVSVTYDSILDIQLSREKGPDLFYVRPFSVDGNISKYLAPLNDLPIDEKYDETKIIPWKNRTGIYYAVPYVGVVQGVYYNQNLFDEYGISVPDSWSGFLNSLATIAERDPEIVPIANALNASEDSEMFMSIAANFLGGPDGRERLMRTDGTSLCYDNPRIVNAFQAIDTLKPFLPRDAATMNSQASKELFFNQEAVMLFGGSWDLQKVTEEAAFNWGVFAVPAPSLRQTYVIFQPDIGIGINKDSPYQEEARLFLEWMMTEDAVNLTARNLVGFYPLNVNKPVAGGGIHDQKFLDLVKQYPGDIRWMFTEISNEIPRASDIIRGDLYGMVAFDITPREAAQNLQSGLGEWYEPAQSCQ